ncbi:thioredoxin domain-containing protein 5-like [Corticium candelabrum]|uniref:thioredoxin domain-containing protein 5-like n=1 Tax=Corticium candelabrum TaxID=121492 RepID=UPI002E265BA0|nr:thioredoxin domain-containing protein 5-like [Corticium candelabrum]
MSAVEIATMSLFVAAIFLAVTVSCSSSSLSDELTSETFPQLTIKSPHFVKFYAPWCGHCQNLSPVWDSLAERYNKEEANIRIAKIDCTQHTSVCSEQGVSSYPTLKFVHGSAEKHYQGNRDLESLAAFVEEMLDYGSKQEERTLQPEVIDGLAKLTAETFKASVSRRYYFIKFYAPWCGHCQRLAPTWNKLAAHFQDDGVVNIGKVDCTIDKDLCAENNVGGYPTLFLYQDGKVIQRYTGGRSLEELITFVNDNRPADEEPETDSTDEEPPSPLPPVVDLTSETFTTTMQDGLTFVKFFAPWCGHCKRLAPVWEQLGQTVKDRQLAIRIAKLDCTAHSTICEEHHVHGYPTLVLFSNGVKVKEYKSSRVLEDLVQFVTDNIE